MIPNTHLESGCVFDAEVQRTTADLGFVHSHVEIALSHTGRKGVDVSVDPDAFVLLEQLRFAYLVTRSIPSEVRRELMSEEKDVFYMMNGYFKQLAYRLLQKSEAQPTDLKRDILRALREFDKFSINRSDIVDAYFGHVEKALDLADQYKSFGVLERLYRLEHHHPDLEMRRRVQTLLFYFVMPALDYVGSVHEKARSPEDLSSIMLALATKEKSPWVGFPTSLSPAVLDAWLKENERAMLGSTSSFKTRMRHGHFTST